MERGKIIRFKTKKVKKRRKVIWLVISIILVFLLFQRTYASYQSRIKGNVIGKIAIPILEVEKEETIQITSLEKEKKYYFSVRNYNEQNQINEVEMEYTIEIIGEIENSIEITLYKNNEKVELEKQKTKRYMLKTREEQEDNYILEILQNTESSQEKTDILKELEIRVNSIQKI